MRLRKLQQKDAPLMLEWMHDDTVVEKLQTDFTAKTIEDCRAFIEAAQDTANDLHLAVVDENDVYMGTVSLKNIGDGRAEFAVAVRKTAMGKGYSKYGMEEIIHMGFEKLGLTQIYWCVAPENKRAVRFYEKNGYQRVDAGRLEAKGRLGGGTVRNRCHRTCGISSPAENQSDIFKKAAGSQIEFISRAAMAECIAAGLMDGRGGAAA